MPKAPGPELYRGMDRATLEREYDARATVPSIDPFLERYAAISADMRATLPCHLDVSYGPSDAETMDVFPAGPNAPVFVFIHGGYWRLLSKDDSAFMAEVFTRAGVSVVALNYALAPAVSLDEIVRQCRAAIAWIYANGREFGIDCDRIFVGGNSAGGHLVGMLTCGDWHDAFGVRPDVIKGALAVSGLFDLEPVRLCVPNEWLRLDEDAVARNSPILHLPERNGCPLLVSWAGSETSEFKRQSREFADAWTARDFPCTAFELSARNHFDLILDLADPDSRMTRETLSMITDDGD
ncbi:alpha/beta hydrolase [Microbaculum marinisediminis]|uniref:Alpha/beta hydrolase n=1 Tax=Microbaculum marinisediminis TaxID=2931392 RepID=A0AAW5R8M9_9HYPH|nr:alpha/beta hydrolase [Microbaculum sp. A6E488]MCT8974735.1 alpha/beta hydrolase [Microbaculum sp. A6E488]